MTQSDAVTITSPPTAADPKSSDLVAETKRKRIVDSLVIRTFGVPAKKKRPPQHGPRAQTRYGRIRSIARSVPGEEYCRRIDRMLQPNRTPVSWQKQGCPITYVAAWDYQTADGRHPWRRKINEERQNAWR